MDVRSMKLDHYLLALISYQEHMDLHFTRGQTQALGVVTLGALGENQIIDGLGLEDTKRFMLHYNFPPFSVGETGRYGGPGRRNRSRCTR